MESKKITFLVLAFLFSGLWDIGLRLWSKTKNPPIQVAKLIPYFRKWSAIDAACIAGIAMVVAQAIQLSFMDVPMTHGALLLYCLVNLPVGAAVGRVMNKSRILPLLTDGYYSLGNETIFWDGLSTAIITLMVYPFVMN
jgi:hypothetical protein